LWEILDVAHRVGRAVVPTIRLVFCRFPSHSYVMPGDRSFHLPAYHSGTPAEAGFDLLAPNPPRPRLHVMTPVLIAPAPTALFSFGFSNPAPRLLKTPTLTTPQIKPTPRLRLHAMSIPDYIHPASSLLPTTGLLFSPASKKKQLTKLTGRRKLFYRHQSLRVELR